MTRAKRSLDQTDRRLIAGRYKLLERIGRGRLGDIYAAEDSEHHALDIERRVAIQLLHSRIRENRALYNKLKLAYNELRAASHPNIVPFLDFGADGNDGYLVMEFLEGASLRLILDDRVTLPLEEVIPVIRAVGDALQFLHAKSIVHRRLTAETVFVTEDLDVRLIDVVPLDIAISIPGGVASSSGPLGRSDATDDIFGLACLTYEMLAGTHPFNFHTLAEARHAELRPARIDSLPEKQWNALCLALTFTKEQRTPAVTDFFREFGIKGTERLRQSADVTEPRSSSVAAAPVPPATVAPVPPAAVAPVPPAAVAIPVARREDALAHTRDKRARWLPSVFLTAVLGGLVAWYYFGQPRDDVAWLIDYIDSYLDSTSTEEIGGGLPIEVIEVSPAVSRKVGPATSPTAIPTQIDTEDATRKADEVPVVEEATTEPAVSRPALIQSVVRVSEKDGAARVPNPYPESTADRIFWWTDDDTAVAKSDFVSTEEPRVGFASGEQFEMLYIPLVNDNIPELRETFFVYLGRHNAQLGRLETVAKIRVEITDDD